MPGFGISFKQFIEVFFFKSTSILTPQTPLFFSLHSGPPGGFGANELTVIDSPGYARAELDADPDPGLNANYSSVAQQSDGSLLVTNLVTISWPIAVMPWNNGNPILYFAAFNDPTTGSELFDGTINGGPGVIVLTGQTLQCLPNNGSFIVV